MNDSLALLVRQVGAHRAGDQGTQSVWAGVGYSWIATKVGVNRLKV